MAEEEKKSQVPNNKFLKVITIAKRARQLFEGGRPLIENLPLTDPIDTAIKEVEAHKILVEIKKPKEFKLSEDLPKATAAPAEEGKPRVRATKIVRHKKAKKKKK